MSRRPKIVPPSRYHNIVISDNIGVRCGCAPGKTWLSAHMLWEFFPIAIVECRTCAATWFWGQP